MVFEPVVLENQNRSQRIVAQIRDLISSGKLKPGDKLPSERELSARLNVSRVSLREAIKTLAAMGLVEVKRGQGVFIIEANIETVISQFAGMLVFKKDEVLQLFEVRKTLEVQAARWASERARPEEIDKLMQLVNEAKSHVRGSAVDYEVARRHDVLFHETIIEASQNIVLIRVMNSLLDIFEESRAKTLAIPGRAAKSIFDHERIAMAISRRDPEKASFEMYQHIEDVENSIRLGTRSEINVR